MIGFQLTLWSAICFSISTVGGTSRAVPSPTALPAHGGQIQRAQPGTLPRSERDESQELFFELVQDTDALILYPLVRNHASEKAMKLSPKRQLREVTVTVTTADSKFPVGVFTSVTDDALVIRLNPLSVGRHDLTAGTPLTLTVAAIHTGISKVARFAVEMPGPDAAKNESIGMSSAGAGTGDIVPVNPSTNSTTKERRSYLQSVQDRVGEWKSVLMKLEAEKVNAEPERRNNLHSAQRYLEQKLETLQSHVVLLEKSRHATWKLTQQMIEAELAAMKLRYASVNGG